jgi:hypothetical protein
MSLSFSKPQIYNNENFQKKILPACRTKYSLFVSTCFRDERGKMISLAPFQEEWLRILQTHRKVVIWAFPESGKSVHFSCLIPTWFLAHRPNWRICVVSAAATQAAKFGRFVKNTIEYNRVVRMVFPDLVPSTPWTDTMLTIRRPLVSKDPSYQAIGVDGAILGARVDVLVLDDILTPQNTGTDHLQDKLWDIVNAGFFSRLTESARVIAVGVKWRKNDVLHRLVDRLGFAQFIYPILDKEGKPLWAERWTADRLAEVKSRISPKEWQRQYLLELTDTTERPFTDFIIKTALSRGSHVSVASITADDFDHVIAGVDLAGVQGGASLTAVHLMGVKDQRCVSLDAWAGKWTAKELMTHLERLAQKLPSLVLAVENNATQSLIADFIHDSLPFTAVIPVFTGSRVYGQTGEISKAAFAMQAGKWVIAKPTPGLQRFIEDLALTEEDKHMPDTVSAAITAWRVAQTVTVTDMQPPVTESSDEQSRKALIAWGKYLSVVQQRDAATATILPLPQNINPADYTVIIGFPSAVNHARKAYGIPEDVVPAHLITDAKQLKYGVTRLEKGLVTVEDPALIAIKQGPKETKALFRLAVSLAAVAATLITQTHYDAVDLPTETQTKTEELTAWDIERLYGLPSLEDFL